MSENEKTSVRASHPMIGLLVGELHQVSINITQQQARTASRGLLNVIDMIAPSHVDAELRKQLALIGFSDKTLRGNALDHNLRRVSDLRTSLMAILWDKGYFTEEAYQFRDLTEGKPRR